MNDSAPAPSADTLTRAEGILEATFGYRQFRGQQAEIIRHVADGGDALVLMPTGGGKSLCYQIPAMLRDGTAVVVSPLIALMKDQVDALRQLGVQAAYLNSSLPPGEAGRIEAALLDGHLDLLYVAPERLLTPRMLDLLDRSRLALFAIDEAHCVSQWGHDFRPEYIQLARLAELFPDVPRMALTATADELTRQEMVERLQLGRAARFTSSFDRPNIRYTVVDKSSARQQLLAFYRDEHEGDAGIVYCLSRKSVDSTAEWLQKQGIPALPYHAGLDASVRQRNQERFLLEEGVVMVATIAFGMGIDKPDVRFVAHLDLPKSLEGYYQETGRAGRDGLPADAFMTYGLADVVTMRRILESGGADDAHKRLEHRKLDALLAFCESARCRRQLLLGYFGEALDEPCGNCDTCLTPVDTWDGTVAAQKLLSTVVRTGQRFGAGHLIDVLLGKTTKRVQQLHHDELSTYGIGGELDERQWRSVVRQLVASGHLTTDPDGYGTLKLAPPSTALLRGEESAEFRRDPRPAKKASGGGPSRAVRDLTGDELELFEALRSLRLELAREQEVPPYVIFHDATLRQMAQDKPRGLAAMRGVSGVGESKLARYGDAFLAVVVEHAGDAPPHGGGAEAHPLLAPPAADDLDTVEKTRELILEGNAPEAVARARNLKLRTVEDHLAELVRRGDLTVEEATGLPRDEIDTIEAAHDALSDEDKRRLKPLYESLRGRYGYSVIKCVKAGMTR